jgi:predicted dehydrogenase
VGDLLSHALDLALLLNGSITEVSSLLQVFVPNREVEDAVLLLARFANGSVGTFEATRFATGWRNRNAFEIHGSLGAIGFNLEDLNRLEVFERSDAAEVQRLLAAVENSARAKSWTTVSSGPERTISVA